MTFSDFEKQLEIFKKLPDVFRFPNGLIILKVVWKSDPNKVPKLQLFDIS